MNRSHLLYRPLLPLLATFVLSGFAVSANAQDPSTDAERLVTLERRVQELEEAQRAAREADPLDTDDTASWRDDLTGRTKRFHLSGNADVLYLIGENNSIADEGHFSAENMRLFLDIELGEDLVLVERPIIGAASFYFEWDFFREGALKNKGGSAYIRLDSLFGIDELNLKFGRFPIPFGEEYLRFHEQRPQNPFITFSAPALYNWDEGLLLFGSFLDGVVEYEIALQDGDDELNGNSDQDFQVTAKLAMRPVNGAYLSVSALRSGGLGDTGSPAKSALEWGGTHATPFGSGTEVLNFKDGAVIADDPNDELTFDAWEVDLVLTPAWRRLWLAYGQIGLDSEGDSTYDRTLHYWIAEAVLELGAFAEALDPIFLATRYSAIGTFLDNEGYSLEAMNGGGDMGFNTESVSVTSVGAGIRFNEHLTMKVEYAFYKFTLVRGITDDAVREAAKNRDYFGVGFTARF